MKNDTTNPLLAPSPHAHGAIPFEHIQMAHFLPAIEQSIDQAKKRLAHIKASTETPNFDNVILALETCSEELDTALSVYFNLFSAEADSDMQALAQKISPLASAFSSDLLLDEELFQKVKAVYEGSHAPYSTEQKRLLEKSYKSFVRNGTLLKDEQKKRLREIDQELATLSPKFSENILKSTNAFELWLEDEKDLAGIPERDRIAAQVAAQEKNREGWLFTLQAPSFIPFITYSEKRELREKIWRASNSCGTMGDTDNREILKKIAKLRHERANLLGYKTHADFVLEERMAKTPDRVHHFLDHLKNVSKQAVSKEIDELVDFKTRHSGDSTLLPWDFAFYAEKLKEEKFQFRAEDLRPYFSLENVIQGVFEHSKRLYDLDFRRAPHLPTYHADVTAYEVFKRSNQDFVGVFYTDFFPRPTKKSGAWMTNYLDQGLRSGRVERPHVGIVCNFTKPTPDQPSLLTLDEVNTLFHEVGHALHGLLSQCTYSSLSGTSVYWDFVELPSQINENWVLEKETLDQFARHYQSGELMPRELIDKIKASSRFNAAYVSLRQLGFALLDMAWHANDPSAIDDVETFEKEALSDCKVLPHIPGAMMSPRFSHIFSGGYSSGYYSYKWAEVLDADAFELFKEKGLYNAQVADSFRKNILERGGTEHPMELYKRFRGREPDPNALLRRDGLI